VKFLWVEAFKADESQARQYAESHPLTQIGRELPLVIAEANDIRFVPPDHPIAARRAVTEHRAGNSGNATQGRKTLLFRLVRLFIFKFPHYARARNCHNQHSRVRLGLPQKGVMPGVKAIKNAKHHTPRVFLRSHLKVNIHS